MFSAAVFLTEKPQLRKPILIEGLPGVGFVANIVALHLISELKAKKFCEIRSMGRPGSWSRWLDCGK